MEYHDNEVHFSLDGDYSLINGSYTVDEFSVTPGQDPDGNIKSGMKLSFGSDGSLVFKVGRKGSESVADWFNRRVSASKTTFNHTADELNFAFIGTLVLNLTGGSLSKQSSTVTFSNVALAQGHAGASNNWWFGGKNCTYIGNDQVEGQGIDMDGSAVSLVFLRGGNTVNEVKVILDNANWMQGIEDSRKLNQIMMPGSHDAGMSEANHCSPPIVGVGYIQTQSVPIGTQLVYGSRYFDIRVDYDYGELVTYHRTNRWGGNGQAFKAVLDQTQAFLIAHPTETVVMKISHIRDYSGHEQETTKDRIDDILSDYSGVIYTNPTVTVNLAELTLGDVRGKMIMVFDYSDHIDTATGRFRYGDGNVATFETNLVVYDQYSDTEDYDFMKKDQLNKWQDFGGQGKGYLFLLSWTLTPAVPSKYSIEKLAGKANSELPNVLYDQIFLNKQDKPNIVYIDYMNMATARSIIQYNW